MSKTVLFVDDSASMRQLVSFTLEDAGYSVVSAVDGRDALAKLNSTTGDNRVAMVIADLNMPVMGGIELIRQLRSMPEHKVTPAIVLTTESKGSKKQEGRDAGASGWIVKPFKPEQLIDVVKKFVR